MKNNTTKRGVTLVEIAIVLVIIGLLLGGVLKGQELINNAKVRSIADRQNSLKVAWFSFIDRYQALPGDYVRATETIPDSVNAGGDGTIDFWESPMVFQHLTGAGYLRCPQCTSQATGLQPAATNSLQNQYGGVMSIWHDGSQYMVVGGNGNRRRLFIHTGPYIPSNIIGEVDRKLDDGLANTGDVVFNIYNPVANADAPTVAQCVGTANDSKLSISQPVAWRFATESPPVEPNCGASVAI